MINQGAVSFCDIRQDLELISPAVPDVPTGLIAEWVGSVLSIPTGWALCDGTPYPTLVALGLTNPDCRGLFTKGPIGNVAGLVSGADTHTHTLTGLNTDLAGSHSHGGSVVADGAHDHGAITTLAGSHDHGAAVSLIGNHDHSGLTDPGTAHRHSLSAITTDSVLSHTHTFDPFGGATGTASFIIVQDALGAGPIASQSHTHNVSLVTTTTGGAHSHGFTGGQLSNNESAHIHSISVVGSHSHSVSAFADHAHVVNNQVAHSHNVTTQTDHTHSVSGTVDPASSLPAYCELHLIIKL